MPSSLVFAALAVAWLVVLVPMVAKHRQEVRRTADSALAARVVHRGDMRAERARPEEVPEEVPDMAADDETHDDEATTPQSRYRPGRGGFDPQAAELAARARYAFRQRVVFVLLLLVLASGLFAGFALRAAWWVHGALDVILVVYLGYLRRQVRIEQEIRARRVARAARGNRQNSPRDHPSSSDAALAESAAAEVVEQSQGLPQHVLPAGAAVVDLDDEDPEFCELDSQAPTPYRRAVGE